MKSFHVQIQLSEWQKPVEKRLREQQSKKVFAVSIIQETVGDKMKVESAACLIDTLGNAMAEIKANGNNLWVVRSSIFINNKSVREDAASWVMPFYYEINSSFYFFH